MPVLPDTLDLNDKKTVEGILQREKVTVINDFKSKTRVPIKKEDFDEMDNVIESVLRNVNIASGQSTPSRTPSAHQSSEIDLEIVIKILTNSGITAFTPEKLIKFLRYHYLVMFRFYNTPEIREQLELNRELRAIDNYIFTRLKNVLKFMLHEISTYLQGDIFKSKLIIAGGAAFRTLLPPELKNNIQTTDYDAFVYNELSKKDIISIEKAIQMFLELHKNFGLLFSTKIFRTLSSGGEPNKPFKIALVIDRIGFKPLIEITFKIDDPGQGRDAAKGASPTPYVDDRASYGYPRDPGPGRDAAQGMLLTPYGYPIGQDYQGFPLYANEYGIPVYADGYPAQYRYPSQDFAQGQHASAGAK